MRLPFIADCANIESEWISNRKGYQKVHILIAFATVEIISQIPIIVNNFVKSNYIYRAKSVHKIKEFNFSYNYQNVYFLIIIT